MKLFLITAVALILAACSSAPQKILVQKDTCREVGATGKVLECEQVKADQK